MITWTYKPHLFAVGFLALSACGEIENLGFLPNALGASDTDARQALMANGAVTLVAPQGFCVDESSKTDTFVLMARCDVVLQRPKASAGPRALITASVQAEMHEQLSIRDLADSLSATVLSEIVENGSLQMAQLSAEPMSKDIAANHWRATAVVGQASVIAGYYVKAGDQNASAHGGKALSELVARSQKATPNTANPDAIVSKKETNGPIASLFARLSSVTRKQ